MKKIITMIIAGCCLVSLTACSINSTSTIVDVVMMERYISKASLLHFMMKNEYEINDISDLKVNEETHSLEFKLKNSEVKQYYTFQNGVIGSRGQEFMDINVKKFVKDDIQEISNLIVDFYKDETLNEPVHQGIIKYADIKETSFQLLEGKVSVMIKNGNLNVICKSIEYT